MITVIRQGDPRWGNVRLGYSNSTMRRYGCTTSDMCMALEKLRGYFCNPGNAARHWRYNRRGEILWKATDFKGMRFMWRGYGHDSKVVERAANSDIAAVILEVNHGKHWVYVESVSDTGVMHIIDPIDGKRKILPAKYKPTGYATFEKEDQKAPEWMEEAFVRARKKGLKKTDLLTGQNIKQFQEILFEMGIIDRKDSKPTLGWLLVVMEKIKERY